MIGLHISPHQFMLGRLSSFCCQPRDGTCTAVAAGPRKAPFRQMACGGHTIRTGDGCRKWGRNLSVTMCHPQCHDKWIRIRHVEKILRNIAISCHWNEGKQLQDYTRDVFDPQMVPDSSAKDGPFDIRAGPAPAQSWMGICGVAIHIFKQITKSVGTCMDIQIESNIGVAEIYWNNGLKYVKILQ